MGTHSLQPGMTIGGKYRLSRMIGQGGMGSVFAAENTLSGKQVAIKCMNRQIAESPEAAQRFLREARASARIRHPNVVDVYDVVADNDTFYLIMELLEGEPLSCFLARETNTLPGLIKVLLGAMRGVAEAHHQGIIHRDIKPDNIFLAREGRDDRIVAKVLDFGISKVQGVQDLAVTAPGLALGTLTYMSFEQLNGTDDIDGRTDVYAFGVILYQAITGRAPFEAAHYATLIVRSMIEQAVPVSQLRPDVPEALSLLVAAAMEKQRDARIPSMDAFIEQLEPFSDDAAFERHPPLTSKFPRPNQPGEVQRLGMSWPDAARLSPPQPGSALPALDSSAGPVSGPAQRAPRRTLRGPALAAVVLVALATGLWWSLRPAERELAQQARPTTPTAQPQPTIQPAPSHDTVPPTAATLVATLPEEAPAFGVDSPPVSKPNDAVQSSPGSKARARPRPAQPDTGGQASPAATSAGAAPARTVKPNCKPNYTFDAQGNKHFKPECF